MNGRDVLGHRDVEQSVSVIAFGRHESSVDTGAARAEGLLSRQEPSIRGESRRCATSRLSGGPDPVGRPRIRLVARFFQDGQRVDMAFDQSGKRQIPCRPIGKRREPSRRAARTRLREHGSALRRDFPQLHPHLQLRYLLISCVSRLGGASRSTRAEPARRLLPGQHGRPTSDSRSMAIATRSYP